MEERIPSKVIHYNVPRLMRHTKLTNLVVLFKDRRSGVVVNVHYDEDGEASYEVGYYADDWSNIDSGDWEDFHGIVELQNGG